MRNFKKLNRELYESIYMSELMYAKWAKKHNIGINELCIIYHIDDQEGITQKKICDDLMFPKQTVNSILMKYVKNGFLEMVNVNNKKEKVLKYTEDGLSYTKGILNELYKLEELILDKLGESTIKEMTIANLKYISYFKELMDNE